MDAVFHFQHICHTETFEVFVILDGLDLCLYASSIGRVWVVSLTSFIGLLLTVCCTRLVSRRLLSICTTSIHSEPHRRIVSSFYVIAVYTSVLRHCCLGQRQIKLFDWWFRARLPVWTLYSGIQCQLPITSEIRTPRWSYCAANPTCEIWSAGICLCCTMRLELFTNWPERLQLVACSF